MMNICSQTTTNIVASVAVNSNFIVAISYVAWTLQKELSPYVRHGHLRDSILICIEQVRTTSDFEKPKTHAFQMCCYRSYKKLYFKLFRQMLPTNKNKNPLILKEL